MEKLSKQVPFVMNITTEQERKLDERYSQDELDRREKERIIKNSYKKPTTNIRIVGEFLYDFVRKNGTKKIISYQKISSTLDIPKNSVKLIICHLNFWSEYPLTWIPVPKMKEFIQSVLRNELDYDRWDRRKGKTIMTMEQVKDKAEVTVSSKRKAQKKKIKVKAGQ